MNAKPLDHHWMFEHKGPHNVTGSSLIHSGSKRLEDPEHRAVTSGLRTAEELFCSHVEPLVSTPLLKKIFRMK